MTSAWQPPTSPYRPGPHFIDHQARPEQVLRFVVDKVEAQGGEAVFITHGRTGKRLMGNAVSNLSAEYRVDIITLDTTKKSPNVVIRKRRKETRWEIRRTILTPPGTSQPTGG